jgi:non-specific serine/threonine protein kinase
MHVPAVVRRHSQWPRRRGRAGPDVEKLTDVGERRQAMAHLAEVCLALFAPFARESDIQGAIDNLGQYRREIGNLRAALGWAFSAEGDAALGVELAAAVSDFWVAMSLVAEAGEWAETALAQIGQAAGTRSEMILRCSLGFSLIYTQGMSARVREILIAGMELARRLEDVDYQQRAACGLWLFSARSMALDDALAYARDYEEVAQGRDSQSRATASWLVGIPQTYMAMHAEASERLEWAVRHYSDAARRRDMMRLGADVRTSASAHNTVNLVSRGFLDTASRTARSTIEEARETNQPFVLCVALAWAAGFVSLSLDELDNAQEYGEELVSHAFKHGLRPFHAAGLCVRGSLAARRGDPEAGIGPLRAGLAEMQDAMYLLFYPFFLTELAAALAASGRLDESLDEIERALHFSDRTKYRWFVPEILRQKGELQFRAIPDDQNVGEITLRRSMDQSNAQKAAYWELSAACSLSEHLCRSGRALEAEAMLSRVISNMPEARSNSRLEWALDVLKRSRPD